MSSKQIARTVLDGTKVSFTLPAAGLVEGYVCGMDDFHWMVVTPDLEQHLIHKSSAALVSFSDAPTYQDETNKSRLEEVVGPFRAWVIRQNLGPRHLSLADEPQGAVAQ